MSKLVFCLLTTLLFKMADNSAASNDQDSTSVIITETTQSPEDVTECSKQVRDPCSSSIQFEQFAEFSEFTIHTTNYTFVKKPSLSWNDAARVCAANCQVLTSVRSLSEYDAILKFLKKDVNSDGGSNPETMFGKASPFVGQETKPGQTEAPVHVWVGGTDQESGVYQWIEEPKRILNSVWKIGEPTNSGNLEHCTDIYGSFEGVNDSPCSKLLPFICKVVPRTSRLVPTGADFGEKDRKACQQKRSQDSFANSLGPYKQRRHHGHIYRLVKQALTWDEAAHSCAENCGVLSSVHSPSELNFVEQLIKVGADGVWLGGTDRINKEWRWIENSEPIPDFFWASRQPDNDEGKERCSGIRERDGPGHDYMCTLKKPFVCKFNVDTLAQNWYDEVPKIVITVFKMPAANGSGDGVVVTPIEKNFVPIYKFQEDTTQIYLACQVFGLKRTANVKWTKHGELQSSHTSFVNQTYSLSQLVLPHVHKLTAGLYTCRAENDGGENSAVIRIRVDPYCRSPRKQDDDTLSTTTVALSISISLIAICIPVICISLVIVWRQVRRLRKAELNRNLRPEEILSFFNGQPVPRHGGGDGQILPNGVINALPYDKKFDVPRHCLELYKNEVLGSGQFGIVVKGFVVKTTEKRELVAIKCAKKSAIDVSNLLALLSEIKIMAFLDRHENVASLVAACTENIGNREAFAAIEFCENGNLAHFLKRNRHLFHNLFPKDSDNYDEDPSKIELTNRDPDEYNGGLSTMTLLVFSRDVANGMMYLTEKNVIHGDIAARNILLTASLVPKISDFGLARVLLNYTNYMKKSQTPVPWKWLSIEALTRKEFSIKSDVWSFGILLWEIFSLANVPYPQFHLNEQFINAITSGFRMKAPDCANCALYDLMLDCWNKEPQSRPEFLVIHKCLYQILSSVSGGVEEIAV